ncbi:MAG: hypothetical protein P8Y28_14035 [Gammaproteobacteria bacterium]|jgi:hypothetical protein
MSLQPCPHCKQETISWWQKYKAAKWALVYCNNCGKRSCSQPFILVFYTLLYTWDLMLFGYLFYLTNNWWYLLTLVIIWLILDIFSVYLPLSAMKSKTAPPTSTD